MGRVRLGFELFQLKRVNEWFEMMRLNNLHFSLDLVSNPHLDPNSSSIFRVIMEGREKNWSTPLLEPPSTNTG